MSGAPRPRLRLFRDGRFLEDEPARAAVQPTPLPAPGSLAGRVVGCGCLLVVVVPLLVVALLGGLVALVSGAATEQTGTTGVVRSVGPGTDADGVRRDHCYEVAYVAGGRDLVHRTCEVTARASLDVPVDESRAQQDERFAAEHPVGSRVRLRHAVEPPYAADGALADLEVTLLHPGRTGVVVGSVVAACALAVVALVLWAVLRGRRRRAG